MPSSTQRLPVFSLWEICRPGQERSHETLPFEDAGPMEMLERGEASYVGHVASFSAPDLDAARWISDVLVSSVAGVPADTARGLREAIGSMLLHTGDDPEKMPLSRYITAVQPMSTYAELARQARERYEPGTGPWTKGDDLDQVDLVHLEEAARSVSIYSDMRGLLAGCVERLLVELRVARGWPTPPKIEPNFTYEKKDEDDVDRG